MRLLFSKGPLDGADLAWLNRATADTVSLGFGAWAALAEGEVLLDHPERRWLWIGAQELVPGFGAGQDPVALAAGSPSAQLDRASGRVTLFAHPLGRGTFFTALRGTAMRVSTSLVDVCEDGSRTRLAAGTVASFFVTLRNRGIRLTDTFVEGVSQLPPGGCAEWNGAELRRRSYWTPIDDGANGTLHVRESAELVRGGLEDVLRRDLGQSAVCLLSGGLDSSAVAGVALAVGGARVSLATYGHDLDSPREAALRQDLSRHLGAAICVLPIPDTGFDLEAVREANRGADAPGGGLFSGIFAGILSAARDAGHDTVITGEGGDEVFDPSPYLLADLVRTRRVGPLLSALSFFASYDYERSAGGLLVDSAFAPLAIAAGLPWPTPARDAFLDEVLGPDFAPVIAAARVDARADLAAALRSGWNLVTYYNYRQVLDLQTYEPADLRAGGRRRIAVRSPLASIEVFRAANTLRLDEQAGPWIGFRSKRLLAMAAGDLLSYDVAYAPKTGIGNLLSRLVGRSAAVWSDHLDASVLAHVGIDVPVHLLDPGRYPVRRSLIWALLLILCSWYRELEDAIDARHRIPDQGRPVRDLR